jgi:hypothetical protein
LKNYNLKKNFNIKVSNLLNSKIINNELYIRKLFLNKKQNLILKTNKYIQFKLFNNSNIFYSKLSKNTIFKFHYNLLKNINKNNNSEYRLDYSDRNKKLKLLSLIYKKSNNINNFNDLITQQNYSKLNR